MVLKYRIYRIIYSIFNIIIFYIISHSYIFINV